MPSNEELERRLAELEKEVREGQIKVERLPFSALTKKLELMWTPDGRFLAPGTLAGGAFTSNAVGESNIKDNAVRARHIQDGDVGAAEVGIQTLVDISDAAVSVATATVVNPTFDTEALDTENFYNVGAPGTTLTVGRAGRYLVVAMADFDADPIGDREVGVVVGGPATRILARQRATAAGRSVIVGVDVLTLAAAATLQGHIWQDSGSTLATCVFRLFVGRISA